MDPNDYPNLDTHALDTAIKTLTLPNPAATTELHRRRAVFAQDPSLLHDIRARGLAAFDTAITTDAPAAIDKGDLVVRVLRKLLRALGALYVENESRTANRETPSDGPDANNAKSRSGSRGSNSSSSSSSSQFSTAAPNDAAKERPSRTTRTPRTHTTDPPHRGIRNPSQDSATTTTKEAKTTQPHPAETRVHKPLRSLHFLSTYN